MRLLYPLIIFFLVSGSLAFSQHRKVSTSANNKTSKTSRKTTSSARKPLAKKPTPPGKKAKLMAPRPVPSRTASVQMAKAPLAVARPVSRYHIGTRAGITYPIYTGTLDGVTAMTGFVGGITLLIGTGRLAFQPELNYTRYAARNVSTLGNRLVGASDVVDIPLLLKISSGTIRSNRFFLNIGPYVAYISSTSLNGKKTSLDGTGADRFSSGFAAGAGMAIKAGPGHMTAELRGYLPFGDNNQPFTGTLLTIPLQVTVGYTFPLGPQ